MTSAFHVCAGLSPGCAAQLPIQLLTNCLGQAMEDDLITWAPATHEADLDAALGLSLV